MSLAKRIQDSINDSRRNRSSAFTRSHEGPFDISIEQTGASTGSRRRKLSPEMIDEFNSKLQQWGTRVNADLGVSIGTHGIGGKKLPRSLRNTYYYNYGMIDRLGFTFRREGVYIHKGVGRGYNMRGGVVVKTAKTLGFNRKPKPWFNPVIASHIPALREIVREYFDNAIINTGRIFIR
ncbi:MAG TPA: hypothetical protein PKN44_10125 [Bacteroidales bacterium]|nr:hypothetical protein [Bacteroidales bacterium]